MIEKIADKIIIVLLLAALVWVNFSKPIVVQPQDNAKLVESLNAAFVKIDQRITALEGTPAPGPRVSKK